MKITSCITDLKEIYPLKEAGTDEFYFAYKNIFNFGSSKSFTNLKKIKNLIKLSHKLKTNIYLAANSYTMENKIISYETNIKNINLLIDMGVDGIIVSNIGLLNYLKDKKIKIILSSVNPIFNSKTLLFFIKNFNISRIILPNQLSSYEAHNIIKLAKKLNIETEVFYFKFFGCTFINGFCPLHQNNKYNCLRTKNQLLNATSFFNYYINGVNYVKFGTRDDSSKLKYQKVKTIKIMLQYLEKLLKNYPEEKARKLFVEAAKDYIWKKE